MRSYKRSEIKDVYRDYVEHLKAEHPLEYEQHEKFLTRYV